MMRKQKMNHLCEPTDPTFFPLNCNLWPMYNRLKNHAIVESLNDLYPKNWRCAVIYDEVS